MTASAKRECTPTNPTFGQRGGPAFRLGSRRRAALAAYALLLPALGSCGSSEGHDAIETLGQAALGEPTETAQTGAAWYYGQTPAQVSSLISAGNMRLVSLRVESASPLLLDVALVSNTGPNAKTWWWYTAQTAAGLNAVATANNARIVNIEPYVVGGTTYFAAIMLHNVGADYAPTFWYYGQTAGQISALVTANNARLIDLREYNGVYAAVMISNTGANQSAWWWYTNITPAQLSSYLAANNAYPISIDPANAGGTTLNVVMNAFSPGFNYWWYAGQTASQVSSLLSSNRARLFDLKSYVVSGTRYFDVLMFGDSWTATQQTQASCDATLTASWNTTAPAVGLGSQAAITAYDSAITSIMKSYGVPGGAVAVMRYGMLELARGYGLADTGNSLIAHPDNLFRLASVSKQITSAAVLKLVQAGKLKLTDRPFAAGNEASLGFVSNPSGTLTPALASITVQELLQHTGGWSRETGCTGCATEGDPMFESQSISAAQKIAGPPNCDQIIQYMQTQPVKWTPGSVSDYSNLGYCVLGAVIEKVTGTSYASWVAANVLSPAGAQGIVQGQTLSPADREVAYYDYAGASGGSDVFESASPAFTNPYGNYYLEAMAAHGAWVSSPIDLLRFQGSLDGRTGGNGQLWTSSITSMLANPGVPTADSSSGTLVTLAADPCTWYGFGWQVKYTTCPTAAAPSNANTNYWHWGDLPGVVTLEVHAANGAGWAASFNSRPSNSQAFKTAIDNALWAAFKAVPSSSWGGVNLFDQYGAYTGWMTESAFAAQFTAQAALGKYPSRVEGYNATGTRLYRAVFAPYHSSSTSDWKSYYGIDCPTYQSYAKTYAASGYETASLQSYVSNDGTRRYQATWLKW